MSSIIPTAYELVQAMIDQVTGLEEDVEQLQDALFRFTVVEDDGLMQDGGEYLCVFEGSKESFEWTVTYEEIEADEISDQAGAPLIAWAEKPTYTP